MECKSKKRTWFAKGRFRINRNIVECKLGRKKGGLVGNIELIETLWNVNELMGWEENATVEELIETLWNVNYNKI